MSDRLLRATHGDKDSPLVIGGAAIPCYVLEDGTRVLSQRGVLTSLGMSLGGARGGSGGARRLGQFLGSEVLKEFISKDLAARASSPILFQPPRGGPASLGYEATILADICDAVLAARKKGKLLKQQEEIADQCEILMRGFARVGIIALVDEVTGYQAIRDGAALRAILDKFLLKEFAAWAKRFPDGFYKEMFRLKGWEWRGMKVNRPRIVAQYTNDLVYDRLAPGLREELNKRNPPDERGNRRVRQHQWLTDQVGHPALAAHIHALMAMQRAAGNWAQFYRNVQRAFPKYGETVNIEFGGDDDY